MAKEICISSTPHETRLAILEDDQLAEIYYERENEYTLAGSIYKGRVTRVLPGMQSAFVDVGLERDAFLYVTDFLEEQEDSADFERVPGEKAPASARREPNPDRNPEAAEAQPDRLEASSDAEPRDPAPQRARGRDRGRGRSHRNDPGRNEAARPEDPLRRGVQAIEITPYELPDEQASGPASVSAAAATTYDRPAPSGQTDTNASAPASPGSAAGPSSPDEEFEQGTRRWRGRRGRRGGSRSREQSANPQAVAADPSSSSRGVVIQAAAASTYAPPMDESLSTWREEQDPEPVRRPERESTGRGTPAPILLPGESLSKYGQSSEPAALSSHAPAASKPQLSTPALSFRPSTLIEVPLDWDGSGQLPGESLSRYRKPTSAKSEFPLAELTGDEQGSSALTSEGDLPQIHAAESAEEHAAELPEGSSPASHSFESSPETSATPSYPEEETAGDEAIGEETIEEVQEFEPEEASASHRIDPVSPSELRFAAPPEELIFEETAVEESSIGEAEIVEEEAPVSFLSVAPERAAEPATESSLPPFENGAEEARVPEQSKDEKPIENQLPTFDAVTATITEPPSVAQAEAEVEEEHKYAEASAAQEPSGEIRAVPQVTKSIWQTFTELVTGKEEPRPAAKVAVPDLRPVEEYPALGYQGQASHPTPQPEAQTLEAPTLDAQILAESDAVPPHVPADGGRSGAPDSESDDEDGEDSPAFQGFAPGSGVLEEETIEEEEYDYTPLHAQGEDHDLEDLEEETLEHQGGADLGELVREAHLEQRVKHTFDGNEEGEEDLEEEEEDLESGAGGFTEEDFAEPVVGETAAQGGNADHGRGDNRNPDRNGERNADRSSDRSAERRGGRGRSRRTGGSSHSGGSRRQNTQASDMPVISELLKQGQEILVQIAKEPIAKKGARITSHIALPGRFLVFMPTVNHVGVSRKIASDEERQRLKRILISEKGTAAGGFIVRTAADGAGEEDLRADIRFLLALWNEIKQRSDEGKAPALIYHDLNLIERVLRDQVSDNFSAIWVDSETEYERIVRFLQRFQPSLVRRVKLYTKETPLFEQFGIQEEISKALKSKVWLKSGGSIVINQTEALVAIDINTGKYVGKTTRLEDTILRTNLDAIPEIVRQIRLRDLGGIIVIDFIDMDERKNRHRVMQALEDELKNDRAPSKVLQFNDFGLVAITRKRVKQSLERTLSVQCEVCTGTGMVKSPTTVCNEIYTEMRKMHRGLERKDVMLRVHPEVVKTLKSASGRWLNELEEMTGKTIIVKSDPALHPEQFDIH